MAAEGQSTACASVMPSAPRTSCTLCASEPRTKSKTLLRWSCWPPASSVLPAHCSRQGLLNKLLLTNIALLTTTAPTVMTDPCTIKMHMKRCPARCMQQTCTSWVKSGQQRTCGLASFGLGLIGAQSLIDGCIHLLWAAHLQRPATRPHSPDQSSDYWHNQ